MIVLDTNVISELFRAEPDQAVLAWVGGLSGEGLFRTAVTRGDLLFGAYCMPDGRRQADLLQKLAGMFAEKLVRHLLADDDVAADAHAELAAARRKLGRPVPLADAMIAGITRSRGATLATGSVRDF